MPTFVPPSDDIVSPVYVGPGLGPQTDPYFPCDPLMHKLMRHFRRQTRGRNIFKMSDGTFLDSQVNGQPPNMIQPPTDPYARSMYTSAGVNVEQDFFQVPYVVRTYYGGCANVITAAEATALNNAGYTTNP